MAEQIRWGVLGNARIARICVIPAIQKSRNGKVIALATRSPDRSKQTVAENHIRNVYHGYDALLEDASIDAVYIPLPNHLHHPWTIKALEAGKHVLCEKPIARNAAEAQEMADTAHTAGLLLMEAFMYRFHPRSLRVKQMVEDGAIGTPRLVRSAFCYRMDDAAYHHDYAENARLQPETGGGALLDVGCYGLSTARWLLNAEPLEVQAQAVYHPAGVDVHLVGTLRFPDDALASLEASFISALQQTFTVVGDGGAIDLPHDAYIPWEKDAVFTLRHPDEETGEENRVKGTDEYQLMAEHFADAVLGKTSLRFSPNDSISNMKAIDAMGTAAKSGEMVILKK